MKKLLFNSSLPRSGSSLIQNIFSQNPDFYCTPTSGTLELIYGARVNFTNDPTFKAQDPALMKRGFQNFCRQGLYGFYDAITEKPIVLEKSRGWGIHYNLLQFILGYEPKIICMVRDLKQIISSMEKRFRDAQEVDSGIINHAELRNTTTPKRVDHYLATQPLGVAIERLAEIFRQGINKRIFFIKYEELCEFPESTMNGIYQYFELPCFDAHNFEYIEQFTSEDDSLHGMFGDHRIRHRLQVSDNSPEHILGLDICNRIDEKYKWYNDIFGY